MDAHEIPLDPIPEGLLSIRDHLRAARKELLHVVKCGHTSRELDQALVKIDEALAWVRMDGNDGRWGA